MAQKRPKLCRKRASWRDSAGCKGKFGPAVGHPGHMTRLAGYLIRLFSAEALSLFALASALLFLGQALRMFDVISVKGQDLGTLIGQVSLTMPTLAVAYAPVCIAIGLARGLKVLQLNQELHTSFTPAAACGRWRAGSQVMS
jgi:lipopolysaccharide export system permease protein